ncbi:DNA polymerase V, subunit C [Desulfamplus magnetovallimortis]|uniref:DNA polymerase V, subunit C n=1 Tax=Desulfamplus magnetovallimortis TaxID=1246637 RepID=A0A1W1HDS2_9BACT|nr:Y-family DNA polymerase [Desulfamplus magnetovallimortis]SLM30586.1 DNA polymerase V, subunit C [Desulfamplus magnetovallimortis]
MSVFALADCNNFYVSCERVFNPKLNSQPVIVLSNNDGCTVSRSNEVKAIGVPFGAPHFKIQHLIEIYKIQVFSSNYALYGDMSNRVMKTLATFTPNIEIYSIDEAFLDLTNYVFTDLTTYAQNIRSTVKQHTGIPISIGVATSKTLAKVANRIAKKSIKANGILDLTSRKYQDKALEITPIEDVWGIGRRYAAYFTIRGIKTALDFKHADTNWIKKKMGINGVRMQRELFGESCYTLDENPSKQKSISSSRSFKQPVTELEQLSEAVSTYIARAAEKLRKQGSYTETITVYVNTNRFKPEDFYFNSKTLPFTIATNYTPEMIKKGKEALRQIFLPGKQYTKAGVLLSNLVRDGHFQYDLFYASPHPMSEEMMKALDTVNFRMGRNCLRYAAMGLPQKQERWKTAFKFRSPAYTTDWKQLLSVL